MSKVENKGSRQVKLQKVLIGVAKHFQNVSSLTLGRVSYAVADLQKLVQQDLDAMAAVAKAKAEFRALVQVERDAFAKAKPVLRLLKAYVVSQYGDAQDASGWLDDFGYAPRKVTKPKAVVRAEAVAKSEATRKARHTAGKKQKAKIKGDAQATPATPPAPHA